MESVFVITTNIFYIFLTVFLSVSPLLFANAIMRNQNIPRGAGRSG